MAYTGSHGLFSKTIIFFIIEILFSFQLRAQDSLEQKSPTAQFLIKRGYRFPGMDNKRYLKDSIPQWPDTLYYNTVYVAKILGSPTIPISFSKLEYNNRSFEVSPTLSIGYGYTWFTGDFIFNENDKISIDPKLFFGLVATLGMQNDLSLDRLTSLFAGGFVGFGQFSLFAGYDFITTAPSINLGGRIDLFTVSQSFMKPIGPVRELRKHKSIATPISYE